MRLHITYTILRALRTGEMSVSQLVRATRLSPNTVTKYLRALEAEGLVELRKAEEAARMKIVSLTAKGIGELERIEEMWKRVQLSCPPQSANAQTTSL